MSVTCRSNQKPFYGTGGGDLNQKPFYGWSFIKSNFMEVGVLSKAILWGVGVFIKSNFMGGGIFIKSNFMGWGLYLFAKQKVN